MDGATKNTGIIDIKKSAKVLILSNFTTLNCSNKNKIIKPYTLAGKGNGNTACNTSPIKDIPSTMAIGFNIFKKITSKDIISLL
jgi:hypothetical protein